MLNAYICVQGNLLHVEEDMPRRRRKNVDYEETGSEDVSQEPPESQELPEVEGEPLEEGVRESESEMVEEFTPPEGILSKLFRRKKRYGLFWRDPSQRRTLHLATIITAYSPPSSYEVEAYYGELDVNKTWLLCEIDKDGKPKGRPFWLKKKRFSRREMPAEAPWDKLAQALDETVEPLSKTVEAISKVRKVMDKLFQPFYEGEEEGGEEEGGVEKKSMEDEILALKIKAYEEAGKAMGEAMSKAFSGMAEAFSNIVLPWQVPQDFPTWAKIIAHPGVRQGMKEIATDLVKDISKSAVEGFTEAMGKTVMPKSEAPPLSDIVSKAKKGEVENE